MPAPSSQRFTSVRIVSAGVRLPAVIERLQRHPGESLPWGSASRFLLAVVGAVFAGPTRLLRSPIFEGD
jgi:hypothetical protein